MVALPPHTTPSPHPPTHTHTQQAQRDGRPTGGAQPARHRQLLGHPGGGRRRGGGPAVQGAAAPAGGGPWAPQLLLLVLLGFAPVGFPGTQQAPGLGSPFVFSLFYSAYSSSSQPPPPSSLPARPARWILCGASSRLCSSFTSSGEGAPSGSGAKLRDGAKLCSVVSSLEPCKLEKPSSWREFCPWWLPACLRALQSA